MTTDAPAYRGLSDSFLQALEDLIDDEHGGRWWRDVLAHPDLFIAVRRESLNVYHRGASIFRVDYRNNRPVPTTHVKYLLRQQQRLVELDIAGAFGVDSNAGLWSSYAGPQTLNEMVKAARSFVGPEKTGLHALIQASANIVDVEIALAGEAPGDLDAIPASDEGEDSAPATAAKKTQLRQDRIDVASVEERGHPKEAWLVFHEAKDYANDELRAGPKRRPAIANQVERYRKAIALNKGGLIYSYPFVCRALVRLDAMRRKVRKHHSAWVGRPQPALSPLISEVATHTRGIYIDLEPRLVVFGFDADQRDGAWAAHGGRLVNEFGLRVYAVGDPKGSKESAAAFRRPTDIPITTLAEIAAKAAKKDAPPSPSSIAVPAGAPADVVLLFVQEAGRSTIPVYLCNAGPAPLTDVVVTGGSLAADPLSPNWSDELAEHDATVPAGTAALIGEHRPLWDGDDLVFYSVQFTGQDGTRHRVEASLNKVPLPPRWVKLDPVKAPKEA